jgi:hypothetical protein
MKLTTEQLDHTLRELAQFSAKIPFLPDEAFSRESLYQVMIDGRGRGVSARQQYPAPHQQER